MLAIRVPRVFDGERLIGGRTVLVDDGRIAGVEAHDAALPGDVPVRDFPGCTLLPGLIDAHVHLCADSGPRALDRLAPGEDDAPDDDALTGVIEGSLRAQLAAGVTAVRDLGDRRGAVPAWRNGAKHAADLPAVVASGPPVTSVRGHCWYLGGEARGEREMREAVRRLAESGADVVKVMASGGVLTPGTDTMNPQLTDAELAAVVAESRALGLPVTAHAHALTAVEQAIRAGVDGIEHCTCLTPDGVRISDELLAALSGSGIFVCATLGHDPGVFVPPAVQEMAARAGVTVEALEQGVRRLYEGGVRLVAGADSGIGPAKPHGILPRTIAEYVQAGLPAATALAAATSVAAEACGLATRKGRIRPGHDADLLLVEGDPVEDPSALRHLRALFLAGRPHPLP
ncbi:amidohydrolase family protein [Nonomuraea rosea]|uniref:Amidohydrolase family protein n=1 Tax=Nonomuraea rosea TaxID=638574 RepID=A0ABP6XIH6_9ACTN